MLSGRQRECGAIAQLLAGARRGRGGALVLRGGEGMGKSALLQHAFVQADGMAVLHAAARRDEADVPYAALRLLLGARTAALDGAAALALLTAESEWPLLCLVDDAHWVDRESAEALAYVARRLESASVALLVALRDDVRHPLGEAGLPELRLRRLRAAEASELLAWRYPGQPAELRERVVADASGNPLALVQLGGSVDPRGAAP